MASHPVQPRQNPPAPDRVPTASRVGGADGSSRSSNEPNREADSEAAVHVRIGEARLQSSAGRAAVAPDNGQRDGRTSRAATPPEAASITGAGAMIIFGHGRSGTHWLMSILDLSAFTHCRSEPNELPGSHFERLPDGRTPVAVPPVDLQVGPGMEVDADLGDAWDEALAWCHRQIGDRDLPPACSKSFAEHPLWHRHGLQAWCRRSIRRVMRVGDPRLQEAEWMPPRWLTGAMHLERARLVVKLNQMQGWIPWLARCRPQCHVLHMIRHPGGFLQSWQRRYLARRDPVAVQEANIARLRQVAAFEAAASHKHSTPQSARWVEIGEAAPRLRVEETELWYWRYAGEMALQATTPAEGCFHHLSSTAPASHAAPSIPGPRGDLQSRGLQAQAASATAAAPVQPGRNVMHVVFEDLARDPVAIARQVYAHCGLPWDGSVASAVKRDAERSPQIADAWHRRLSTEDRDLVNRILDGSPLQAFWPE